MHMKNIFLIIIGVFYKSQRIKIEYLEINTLFFIFLGRLYSSQY